MLLMLVLNVSDIFCRNPVSTLEIVLNHSDLFSIGFGVVSDFSYQILVHSHELFWLSCYLLYSVSFFCNFR